MAPRQKLLIERVTVTATGCWEWNGYVDPRTGYGQYHKPGGGSNSLAHRSVYEAIVGPIEPGLHLDHLCRNRRCVNPDHLEPVTPWENNRRSTSLSARNLLKTHCVAGHPFDDENTWIRNRPRPARVCKECNRIAAREYQRRRRGAA